MGTVRENLYGRYYIKPETELIRLGSKIKDYRLTEQTIYTVQGKAGL